MWKSGCARVPVNLQPEAQQEGVIKLINCQLARSWQKKMNTNEILVYTGPTETPTQCIPGVERVKQVIKLSYIVRTV